MALYFKDPSSEGVVLNLTRPKSTSPVSSPLHHTSPYTTPTIDKLYPTHSSLPFMYLPMTNTKSMSESAADLLFMNMNWARSLPAFTSLSLRDQVRKPTFQVKFFNSRENGSKKRLYRSKIFLTF
uniref:Nuclear receptor subfamily 2 group E member 1 n=1 Tax=Cacopsylla melanoneura TaxID=428564 RepID=A0A8D8RX62_9HEMI